MYMYVKMYMHMFLYSWWSTLEKGLRLFLFLLCLFLCVLCVVVVVVVVEEGGTNRTIWLLIPAKLSLNMAETEQLCEVKWMIGGIGDMLFSIFSQTENV